MKRTLIRLNRIQNKIALGFLIVVICFVIAILGVTNQMAAFQKETEFITNHDMEVQLNPSKKILSIWKRASAVL